MSIVLILGKPEAISGNETTIQSENECTSAATLTNMPGNSDVHIVTCRGVIIEGVWTGDWIY
jgi:hypothetical protein